jgi:hypothetical protein
MLSKKRRGPICAIARVVNAPAKEAMIQENHREWSLTCWNLHNARDGQPVTGIINQVRSEFIVFTECRTDVDLSTLKLMLAKALDCVGKD